MPFLRFCDGRKGVAADLPLCICAQLVKRGRGAGAASVQLAVMLPLAYTCFCAYYSLFKLGNFSFYKMVRASPSPGYGGILRFGIALTNSTNLTDPSL